MHHQVQVLENMKQLVFQNGKPEESLKILNENSQKFVGLESSDLKSFMIL